MKFIYARQSIEKKDSISIEAQIDKCIALCTYNGWDYKVFKDSGYSGKNLKRPGFTAMMEEVKRGNNSSVICYRLDRISRSIADFSNLIVEFEKYGTDFISVTENFDTTTPLGRAMVNIIMTFAQLERETIADRVTDNYYARTKLGHWGGGPAPYGYNLEKVKGQDGKKFTMLKINPDEAKIVKLIFEKYLEIDGSVSKIIDLLDELRIPSRGGSSGKANHAWTSRVVSEILWRPLYAPNDIKIYNYFKGLNANFVNSIDDFDGTKAVNLYGKMNKSASKHKRCRSVNSQYFIVSGHEPIIDSDTWLKVQAKKKEKLKIPSRSGTGTNSVFTGIMKCAECGRSVSVIKSERYKGYVCSSRKNRGNHSCPLPIQSARYIDPMIFNSMLSHYGTNKDAIIELIESKAKYTVSPVYLAEKNKIELNITKIDEEIENLISSIADGNATFLKYINEKIEKLDLHKRELLSELNDLELNEYGKQNTIDNSDDIINCINTLEETLNSNDFDEIRRTCNLLINSITFHADKSIDINYFV